MSKQDQLPASQDPARCAALTGSGYPGVTPEAVKELLMPVVKKLSYEFGSGTKQMGVLVTDEMMEVVGLIILGTASCAAHAVLHARERLLADPTVNAWADTSNNVLCDTAAKSTNANALD